MSELKKPLLVLKASEKQSLETLNRIGEAVKPIAERLGAESLVIDHGDVEVHQDISAITKSIDNLAGKVEAHIEQSAKMIEITAHLLQALAEQEEDEVIDAEPETYLNGQPKV